MLELQPQEGLHVLSIVEGADITWSEMGSFAANELYVWLAEVPVPEPAGSPPAPAGPAAQAAAGVELAPAQLEATPAAASPPPVVPPPTRMEIRPVKMLAQGNVSADARQFQGQTPRLEIWFDQPEGTAPRAAETHPSDAAAPELTPAPALPAAASAADNDKQWELIGDWIRLRLRMDPTRPTVHEATVVGNVRLAQRAPLLDDTSLLITGDMLQLRTDLLDRSTVDVNGVEETFTLETDNTLPTFVTPEATATAVAAATAGAVSFTCGPDGSSTGRAAAATGARLKPTASNNDTTTTDAEAHPPLRLSATRLTPPMLPPPSSFTMDSGDPRQGPPILSSALEPRP